MYSFSIMQQEKISQIESARTLKTLKCLRKILFNMNIMDPCLLLYSCILFKLMPKSYKSISIRVRSGLLKNSVPINSIFD